MSHLYALCGLPFSGKSTLARAIADYLGIDLVEVDALVVDSGWHLAEGPIGPDQWTRAYRSAYRQLERHLAAGEAVVFDSTAFIRAHRERLRRMAARYQAGFSLIWLDVPAAEIAERRRRNRLQPARPDVDETNFAEIAGGFEAPTAEEAPVVYQPAVDLTNWLQHVPAPRSHASVRG